MTYDDYVYTLTSVSPALTVYLPKDIRWVNELTWSPVEQNVEYSLTGALCIQEGVKLAGRLINLEGKEDMAWMQRSELTPLIQMRNIQGLQMQLTFLEKFYNGSVYSYINPLFSHNVMFNHVEGAVEIDPIVHWDQYELVQWYKIKSIKLIEV